MPPAIRVCASVLYWQTRELPLLEESLNSLLRQELGDGLELSIMVVDNGCGVRPRLPECRAIQVLTVAENRGFAGGHNLAIAEGMRQAFEYFLLFNSDAFAEAGMLREMVAAAESQPRAAFLGPVLVRANTPELIESAGQSFNLRTARHRELLRGKHISSLPDGPYRADAVSGCALLARRKAVETIGLLDEQLFAYFEDMDWCLRAAAAGYSVQVVPRARARHVGQGSTAGPSVLATHYSVRNHMILAARYAPRHCGRLLMGLASAYQLAFLLITPPRRTRAHLVAFVRGARRAWAWSPQQSCR